MGLSSSLRNIFFGAHYATVEIAPCIGNASPGCDCTRGHVNGSGHVVCVDCDTDHGEYAGANTRKRLWR